MNEYHCIQVKNCRYFSFYRLDRVAKFYDLDFDRGTAKNIYQKLECMQKVEFLIQNDNTFITLTKIGQKIYPETPKRFIDIKVSASIQNKLVEETRDISISLPKDVKINPRRITSEPDI